MSSFDTYRRLGQRRVTGYTEPAFLRTLGELNGHQRRAGVRGPVAEIGVHHGQLFIAMKLLQRQGEPAVAIDLFGDQHLNVDSSGEGNLRRFRANVDRWSDGRNVIVHEGDSTKIKPDDIPSLRGARLFSVDGGHVADTVRSDMRLAECVVCDGAIVIADDVFNGQWPSVAVGTLDYMKDGRLVPFAVGQNKTLFTTDAQWAARYRDVILDLYGGAYTTAAIPDREFAQYRVVTMVRVPRTPAHLMRRSPAVRRAARAVLGISRSEKARESSI